MLRKWITTTAFAVLLSLLFAVGLCTVSYAQDGETKKSPGTLSSFQISPGEATSNGIFDLIFTYNPGKDDVWPLSHSIFVTFKDAHNNGGTVQLPDINPVDFHYWKVEYDTNSKSYTFHIRTTSGLHMAPNGTPCPDPRIYYLDAGGVQIFSADYMSEDGGPLSWSAEITMLCEPNPDDIKELSAKSNSTLVHDSFPGVGLDSGYNGIFEDRDYLYAYNEYGDRADLDPLNTKRWDGQSPDVSDTGTDPTGSKFINTPDDGTTSTTYTFQVLYVNRDGLPPIQYLPDYRLRRWSNEANTGVVLYLLNTQTNQFFAYPMQAQGTDFKKGVIYKYVFGPSSSVSNAMVWMNENGTPGNNYSGYSFVTLPMGEYQYFFGCSDDNLRGEDSSDIPDWGDIPPWVPGDPEQYHDWNWITFRHDLFPVDNCYDLSRYVDRVTYQPGTPNAVRQNGWIPDYWAIYPFSAQLHPIVSLGLFGPKGEHGEIYDGQYPWRGTITPFRRAVDPVMDPLAKENLETAGIASSDQVYFQIKYAQLYSIFPEDNAGGEISVWINDGIDATAPYTRYPLRRVSGDTGDVTGMTLGNEGVLYKTSTPITLKPGSHTYYFTASDGKKFVRFPVGSMLAGGPSYPITNYFNGPFVNNPPTLTNPGVTPTSGTSGDNFRFTVTYTDKDGQRPYQMNVVIQFRDGGTLENGGAIRTTMTKLNPTDSNYKTGVTYYFDSKNLSKVLQPGENKFYFEFMDDWGAVTNANDRVQGETVWSGPAGTSGSYSGPTWISGPYIRSNQRPLLTNGTVTAADGTANVATLWTYKATFTDYDNQKPMYINVYIGKKMSDNSILWDNGHAMLETDPSDQLFSDGKDYMFSTTLAGGDPPSQYYYCFVASDGIDVAQFDARTSPSADVVWATPATSTTVAHLGERLLPKNSNPKQFETTQHPLVGKITSATVQGLYTEPIVYTDKGTQLTWGLDYDLPYATGIITLNDAVPATQYIDVQYLFGVPGPTSVGVNSTPKLSNGTVSPLSGRSSDKYTFSIVYTDTDGPSGQAPSYVRLIVDGVVHSMTAVAPGTPNYKAGAQFSVQLSLLPGVHHYYFEASDGAGYCIYDINGSRSSQDPILGFVPLVGPYVADDPTLTNPTIIPTPTGTPVDVSQSLSYSVVYTDNNNVAPNSGYPVLYIDNPIGTTAGKTTEIDVDGKSTAITSSTITDNKQNWTPHQFKGLPVQITSGRAQGYPYEIGDNDATSLTLLTTNLVSDGVQEGDTFSVGKLVLFNTTPTNQTYSSGITYGINIPGLGVGTHSAHFKSVTTKVTGDNTTKDVLVRTTEMAGPTVAINTSNNHAPVLTYVAPTMTGDSVIGQSSDKFMFTVNYQDADGDAPTLHNNVAGYMKVVIDGVKYDMLPPGSGMLVGVDYSYPDPITKGMTLPAGNHTFHYEASDGYVVTTLPATGEYKLSINQGPTLTSPTVTPITSNWGRSFVFSVMYTDVNNDAPYGNVSGTPQLWIDDVLVTPTDADGNTVYTVTSDDKTWAQGKAYSFALARNYFINQARTHRFQFKAGDGKELGADSSLVEGPIVHENEAPTLSLGGVTPPDGRDGDTYTYSVEYTDSDRDDPEYINVEIDGGTANAITLPMTKVDVNAEDPSLGIMYTVSKVGLPVGTHTYAFKTSDWLATAVTNTVTGPNVAARQTAQITLTPVSGTVYVGIPVTVRGSLPAGPLSNLSVRAIRPDGTNLGTHTVTTATDGAFSDSWTFDVASTSTPWSIVAHWDGNGSYAPSDSAPLAVNVHARPTALITVIPSDSPTIGASVTVQGKISFDSNDQNPPQSVMLTVAGTNGTHSFSKNVNTLADGTYSTSWVPDITGNWTITVTWLGNTTYPKATGTASANVAGNSMTINGLAMMSIPMQTTSGFPDSILGKDIPYAVATWYSSLNDYKIYSWFAGGRQDLQVIIPGQGFWIKTYQPKTITPTGSLWPSGTDCIINLDGSGGGWNQIGCPANYDIPWGSLQVISNGTKMSLATAAANGLIRDYGWRYDTSKKNYVLVDANRSGAERLIQPWSGYWIRALASGLKLVIPTTDNTVTQTSVKSLSRVNGSYDPASWLVTLVAKNGDLLGNTESFGVASNADRIESPASLEDYVDLYFTGNGNGHYAYDVRSKSDADRKWSFSVTSDVAGDVQLSWAGLDTVPGNCKLTLVNDSTNKSVEMLPGGSYTFRAEAGAVSAFHIIAESN